MNGKHILFLCSVLSAGFIVGCSNQQLVQDKINDEQPKEIVLSPTGERTKFVLTFGSKWSLNSYPDWLTCSKSEGSEGTYQIEVGADVNRSRKKRDFTLVFSSRNGETVSIPVSQDFPFIKMTVEDADHKSPVDENNLITFFWNHSSEAGFKAYDVIVESNVDWRFVFSEEFGSENFIISKAVGKGSDKISLTTNKNNLDKQAFNSVLTLEALMPGAPQTIIGQGVDTPKVNLHQNNLRFLLNDKCEDLEVTVDELNNEVIGGEIQINSELPWRVDGGTSWVDMSTESSSDDVCSVSIKANGPNPLLEQRDYSVKLLSEGGAARYIIVHQKPYIFNLLKELVNFENQGTSTITVDLQTTGPWKISNSDVWQSWLTAEPLQGEGSATITLKCKDQNLSINDLKTDLKLESTIVPISKTVSVAQDKFAFEITPASVLSNIPTLSTDQYDAQITCSGDWSLTVDQDWVSISDLNGTGNKSVKIGANTPNPDLDNARTATVTLVSETHKARGLSLEATAPLLQREFQFELKPSTTSIIAYQGYVDLQITCSGGWEITASPGWLKPNKTSGLYDDKIRFTAETNSSLTTPRQGQITVKSTYNNVIKSTDFLVQDHFVFDIKDHETRYDVPAVDVPVQSFALNCTDNASWTISYPNSSDKDWIKRKGTTELNGTGSGNIQLQISDNPLTDWRSGSVRFTCDAIDSSIDLNFLQGIYQWDVRHIENEYPFGPLDDTEYRLQFDCSSNWTIECNSDWVVLTKKTGKGDGDVTLSVKNNTDTKARPDATVTIYSNLQKGTANELKKEFTVRQSGYRFDSSSQNLYFDPIPSPNYQSVSISCSGKWGVDVGQSWIHVSSTGGEGDGSIDISVDNNTSQESRSTGTVTIYSKDNNSLKKVVSVNQAQFVFSVPKELSSTSNGGDQNVRISCTSAWTASTKDNWITLDKTDGPAGETDLKITIQKNSTGKERTGTVEVKSQYGHTGTITITQAK